ncbi:MAG: hypothetical protein GF332_00465 [Candidatus Moranbacteria bacterium]|nr:hypothetical protein [Candidatus Moranbacteria bacterium]
MFEIIIFSFSLSIVLINFLILFLNHFQIVLNFSNLATSILILIGFPWILTTFPQFNTKKIKKWKPAKKSSIVIQQKFNFIQFIIFNLAVFLSIFLSAAFLIQDIVPNNTDLGHHMYWTQIMNNNQDIPDYKTSDVIVGEHIAFLVLTKITRIPVLSAFPVLFLSLIAFISFLTLYNLTLRLFQSKNLALLVFIIAAVLYPISAPYIKFASGGVVGNIMGNLFIPVVLYFIYLGYKKNQPILTALGIFLSFGLIYIHHLSAFLLIFILVSCFLMQLFFSLFIIKKGFKPTRQGLFLVIRRHLKLFINPWSVITIIGCLGFFFFIYTPQYIQNSAIKTVAQAPIKESHQGVSLASFLSSTGEYRAAFGFFGLALMIFFFLIKKPSQKKWLKKIQDRLISLKFKLKNKKIGLEVLGLALIFGWTIILIILSFYPGFLKVDLPSRRVVNYLIPVLSISAGYFIYYFFTYLKFKLTKTSFIIVFFLFLISLSLNGFADSLSYYKKETQFKDVMQTFHASRYLERSTNIQDVILKDHANLVADTWIKFFLLRGYDYVLSRTFDYKYKDPTSNRDKCPFIMATSPDSTQGQECFQENQVGFIILRKGFDNYFFEKSINFSKIYESPSVVVFKNNSKNERFKKN